LNLPAYHEMFSGVIAALKGLGGSARPPEVYESVANNLSLSEEQINIQKKSGGSVFENRVAWARFYLAKAGYIDSSKQGVWTLTDKGGKIAAFTDSDIQEIIRDVQAQSSQSKINRNTDTIDQSEVNEGLSKDDSFPDVEIGGYKDQLKSLILKTSPIGFEKLCQRLLRESGFEKVEVTRRSGDGGIDGIGVLQINPFVSFKVLFQSKRYSGTVVVSQVRDFRGAMMGRADKGLIITTGSFTSDAKKEAIRDGVPPIELIDGDGLVELFEKFELGLIKRTTYDIDTEFFKEFKD